MKITNEGWLGQLKQEALWKSNKWSGKTKGDKLLWNPPRSIEAHSNCIISRGHRHTFNSKPHFYPGIYLSSHTSTKPHFQQSTLLPSHTYNICAQSTIVGIPWDTLQVHARCLFWAFRVIFFIKLNVWNVYFSCTVVWIQDMELVISLLRIISSISASFLLIGPGAQMKRMNQFRRTITIWLPALQ